VSAKHQTALEVAELEKLIRADAEKRKLAKEAQEKEKNKPKPAVAIKLPAGAKNVNSEKDDLEFTVAAGKAKAAIEDLRKQLGKGGWKEMEAVLKDMAGTVIFAKDGQTLSIIYLDAGFMPAQITISGPGVEIEK